jgi:arylsulfatase
MNMLDRRDFLRLGAGALASARGFGAVRKPNFLVILADDMGYSDAGCYSDEIDRPISGLAKAACASPKCTPPRAAAFARGIL